MRWIRCASFSSSRRTGSRSNVREANGRHRNRHCRCSSRTGSGALANEGGAIRLGSGMMPIMINPAINRHFFRKARVFRVIINFSRPAMRLRQSGGTQAHPCGDCQRQNAIRHALCSRPPKVITVSYNYVGVLAGTTDVSHSGSCALRCPSGFCCKLCLGDEGRLR